MHQNYETLRLTGINRRIFKLCAQNWQMGGTGFTSLSSLSIQPFGIFRGFLQKSHKYGLGSLRKTPAEGISLTSPGPTSGQLALNLELTNQSCVFSPFNTVRKINNKRCHVTSSRNHPTILDRYQPTGNSIYFLNINKI